MHAIIRLLGLQCCLIGLVQAADLWLAVGYGGRRMISTDGRTWTITAEWAQPGGDDGNNLISAVWAKERFVVAGGGGPAGHILVSRDGREWKEVLVAKARMHPVVSSGQRLVVGSSGYASGKLLWSDDGEQWKPGAAISAKGFTHFRSGAFGNGVFVFAGNGGGSGGRSWTVVSPDGVSITGERDDQPGHGTMVFAGGRFVMITGHHAAGLITSTDGLTWTPVALPAEATVDWLVEAGGRALAGNRSAVYASADGVTWAATGQVGKGAVLWSDGKRSIATSWPGSMHFTADGTTWLPGNALTANGINRVVRAGP